MNDDYLWDRTGEPDAEVQELEDVLSTLRYQAQPLALPAEMKTAVPQRYFPALAIAAAIALLALALGVWMHFQRQRTPTPNRIAVVNKDEPRPVASVSPAPRKHDDWVPEKEPAGNLSRVPPRNNPTLARHVPRRTLKEPMEALSPSQRAEAEAAKDQVMLALRVTSAKLNLAQRKAVPATNNIRFQHKVG